MSVRTNNSQQRYLTVSSDGAYNGKVLHVPDGPDENVGGKRRLTISRQKVYNI